MTVGTERGLKNAEASTAAGKFSQQATSLDFINVLTQLNLIVSDS